MNRIDKLKSFSPIKADATADIGLINEYAVKELTPDEVFCFSLILCDNEVDRDVERFTNESLELMAELFLGKTMLFDHYWSAESQKARLYRVFTEKTKDKNSLGENLVLLRGSAYMLREGNDDIIKAIEGGILKEVSVGCQMEKCACSICGESLHYQWQTGKSVCKNDHIKGDTYDGKLCVGDLMDPQDAYEVSFVAVPAQKGAGVTKSNDNCNDIVELLKTSDLSKISTENKKEIIKLLQMSLSDDEERKERAKLIAENKKYLEVK
jgi:hypothetical protein